MLNKVPLLSLELQAHPLDIIKDIKPS